MKVGELKFHSFQDVIYMEKELINVDITPIGIKLLKKDDMPEDFSIVKNPKDKWSRITKYDTKDKLLGS